MTQKIRFELNGNPITDKQAHAISILAMRCPDHDLRVSDDQGILKIYVGQHYKEEYRFWVGDKGILPNMLVEKDFAVNEEDSNWDKVERNAAEIALSRIGTRAAVNPKRPVYGPLTFDGLEVVNFASRPDAVQVLDYLENVLDHDKFVSVADLYTAVGLVSTKFTDTKFGWNSLSAATIKEVDGKYTIDFPEVVPFA